MVHQRSATRCPALAEMHFELVGGSLAHIFQSIATFDQPRSFAQQTFKFDRAHFRTTLLPLGLLLGVFIVVKLALQLSAGTMEHVGERPAQIFEIRLQPGVEHSRNQRIEHIGDGAGDHALVRQRSWIGFVGKGTVAIKGQLIEQMGCMGGLVVAVVNVARHHDLL